MLAVCVLSALLAQTPTPAERLVRAEQAQVELEYAAAAEELMAIITDPRATDDQLFEANLRAGVLQRIMGNDVEARLHFLYVLKRRPDHQLAGDLPPKVTAFFELVRQELHQSTAPPAVGAQPPAASPTAPAEDLEARAPAPAGGEESLLFTAAPWGAMAISLGLAAVGVAGAGLGMSPLLVFLFTQSQLSRLERGDPSAAARDEAAATWELHHGARLSWEGWGVWVTAASAAAVVVLLGAAAVSAGVGAGGLVAE